MTNALIKSIQDVRNSSFQHLRTQQKSETSGGGPLESYAVTGSQNPSN